MTDYVEVGSVYIIVHPSHEGYVKVGKAKNFVKRLSAYQTYCPHGGYWAPKVYAVALDAMDRAERHAHAALTEYRCRGEWFQIEPEEAIQVLDDALSQFQIGISDESLRAMHKEADNKRVAANKKRDYHADPEKSRELSREKSRKFLTKMGDYERKEYERARKAAYRARKRQGAQND